MMGSLWWLLGGASGFISHIFFPLFLVFHLNLLLPTTTTVTPTAQAADRPTRLINIGAVLSSHQTGKKFQTAIDEINKEHGALPAKVKLGASYILMDDNPIKTSSDICQDLITKKVSVVIVGKNSDSDLSPAAVSFTCGFYRIPVIGISARNSIFSDKTVHNSFMRTVPPYSDQTNAWVELVLHYQWSKVIFLYSSDAEGRAMLASFQSSAEGKNIEIEKGISFTPGLGINDQELKELSTTQARVMLLYASKNDATQIYRMARKYNMTGLSYVWIVTEQALQAKNVPTGVLGFRLQVSTDNDQISMYISDSIRVIAQGLKTMMKYDTLTDPPPDCNASARAFISGPSLYRYMRDEIIINGLTGDVSFDSAGDRLNPTYELINVVRRRRIKIGTYQGDLVEDKLKAEGTVIWPGGQHTKPKGIKISSHLNVVTIEELPFIYKSPKPPGSKCDVELNKRPCPKPNMTGGPPQEFCCYGYAIDLLEEIAKTVNFTYDLHLVADNNYGSNEIRNKSSKKEWNGMIGELIDAKADLIVAPLTMDPERAQFIDFSKPFKYQGLTILVKKTKKDSSLASFLQPFQNTLWILVGLSVHVVALVLYLLDRFSPFGRFKLAKSDDTEEDALNLSSAMWFAWGVLLNSGIGEGTPRSFSARVLGMVWAGFAMIIVASYTANLAAFLVLDRPEASITGIDDARLRNPQDNSKYATVKHSAVAMYFKRQVELSTMYREMVGRNYANPEDAIRDVKEGKELHAFIWDSSRLEYEAANDCDLVTAGELFGRSAYGIGLPKGSPWTQEVSLAILSFHESGYMEQLDGKWILVKDTKCPEKDTSPATLGLTNMAGVFMIVAGGIVAGVFLIFVEIAYKRHRGLKEKELELAKTAADRWRGNIEKRKTLKRNLLQQQQQQQQQPDKQRTNGTSSPGPPKLAAFNKTVIGGGGTSASGYQRVPATVATLEIKDIGSV